MKELEKLNILRVNKTDHNNMFYFFIQTLQFNFNFENWQFKKVFSSSFYTIQVCQGLLIGIYCQRFVAPNLYKGERMTVDLSRYTSSRLHSLLSMLYNHSTPHSFSISNFLSYSSTILRTYFCQLNTC